jgi:hypothetical protein
MKHKNAQEYYRQKHMQCVRHSSFVLLKACVCIPEHKVLNTPRYSF